MSEYANGRNRNRGDLSTGYAADSAAGGVGEPASWTCLARMTIQILQATCDSRTRNQPSCDHRIVIMGLDDHHVRQARSLKHLMDLRHIQVLERTVIHQRQLFPRRHDLTDSAYVPTSAK